MKDYIGIQNYIDLAKRVGLPVIVGGRRGPTGKSTLCDALKQTGIDACEWYEVEEGHKKLDQSCYLLIQLNELLPNQVVFRSSNNE